jgi:hypothetical protein
VLHHHDGHAGAEHAHRADRTRVIEGADDQVNAGADEGLGGQRRGVIGGRARAAGRPGRLQFHRLRESGRPRRVHDVVGDGPVSGRLARIGPSEPAVPVGDGGVLVAAPPHAQGHARDLGRLRPLLRDRGTHDQRIGPGVGQDVGDLARGEVVADRNRRTAAVGDSEVSQHGLGRVLRADRDSPLGPQRQCRQRARDPVDRLVDRPPAERNPAVAQGDLTRTPVLEFREDQRHATVLPANAGLKTAL